MRLNGERPAQKREIVAQSRLRAMISPPKEQQEWLPLSQCQRKTGMPAANLRK